MKSLKKKVATIALMVAMIATPALVTYADTVYYKGTPVNWQYGRSWGVKSYSEVQTHNFEHCATANSAFSGWQKPGIVAYASQFVGLTQATAYWDCRG